MQGAPADLLADSLAVNGVRIGPPCPADAIDMAESDLGVVLPEPIRRLLLGGDGRFDLEGQWWVAWPLERIVQENLEAWSHRGLPRSLLAIGDDGAGDPFCLRLSGGGNRVVRWSWIDSDVAEDEGPWEDTEILMVQQAASLVKQKG